MHDAFNLIYLEERGDFTFFFFILCTYIKLQLSIENIVIEQTSHYIYYVLFVVYIGQYR